MNTFEAGKEGLSRIELICICVLIAVAIGLAVCGITFYKHSTARGDDGMRENTCERVATVNLLENGCVVSGCDRVMGETCIHELSDSFTYGYYDAVAKKVIAEKPEGYNEYKEMKIEGRSYSGEPNTMVIKVEGHGDKVKLSWVHGSE